jgi:hypothetical protein
MAKHVLDNHARILFATVAPKPHQSQQWGLVTRLRPEGLGRKNDIRGIMSIH